MTEPPTLTQQIEAVQWALGNMVLSADPDFTLELRRCLQAALETLKHLDFMRETL
jgi:hypothetical protein